MQSIILSLSLLLVACEIAETAEVVPLHVPLEAHHWEGSRAVHLFQNEPAPTQRCSQICEGFEECSPAYAAGRASCRRDCERELAQFEGECGARVEHYLSCLGSLDCASFDAYHEGAPACSVETDLMVQACWPDATKGCVEACTTFQSCVPGLRNTALASCVETCEGELEEISLESTQCGDASLEFLECWSSFNCVELEAWFSGVMSPDPCAEAWNRRGEVCADE